MTSKLYEMSSIAHAVNVPNFIHKIVVYTWLKLKTNFSSNEKIKVIFEPSPLLPFLIM